VTDSTKGHAHKALLISNWEFPAGNLPTLEGARHDASVLKDALTDEEFGLFAGNITECINKPVFEVRNAIGTFIDGADNDDTLLLYYSGHGERVGSSLYLAAYDTDGKNFFGTGLDTDAVNRYIADRNRASGIVIVLDCCHAGAFGDKSAPASVLPDSLFFGEGQYLLASSRWSEASQDTSVIGRPSPFTEALSKALLDPRLPGSTKGFLTIQEVYRDLNERYVRKLLPVGPEKKDHGRGEIVIARRPVIDRGRDYSRLIQRLVLEGTGDELFSVAISPDCKTIAAGTDGAVLLWTGDTEIWRWGPTDHPEPVPFKRRDSEADLHSAYVYSVAFSLDGRLLASADEDGYVQISSLVDGRAVLDGRHDEAVYSVAFAPDGRVAASGGWDRKVVLWDVENNTVRRKLRSPGGRISSVAFAPQSPQRLLAAGSLDNKVLLWDDVAGGSPKILEVGHTSSVECVAFSPDGSLLASCGLDKSVRVWDVRNKRKKWANEEEHEYLVRSVAFAPDGETLVSASWDKTMKLWGAATGEVKAMPFRKGWQEHDDWIWAVTFSPDGRLLASAGSDSKLIIWSLPD
jgi:Caspase domain/WD domain, G-beta repeat